VVSADGVLDGPGDGVRRDGDQAELVGDAEHHDVDVLLGAQPLLAQAGEVLGVGEVFAAVAEDLVLELLGVEVLLAQEGVDGGLLV
jgi:hypothetical protein